MAAKASEPKELHRLDLALLEKSFPNHIFG